LVFLSDFWTRFFLSDVGYFSSFYLTV
jgi:hypothetical protein